MGLERNVVLLFNSYTNFESLPKDEDLINRFIRYDVGLLQSNSKREKALQILIDAGPEKCARYVVGALHNPHQAEYAKEYLLLVGPTRDTVNPLTGALRDDMSKDIAESILMSYGLTDEVSRALVGCLSDEIPNEAAVRILKNSSPTVKTYACLSAALYNPRQRQYAKEILIHYGHNLYSTGYVILIWMNGDVESSNAAREILLSHKYGNRIARLLIINSSKRPNYINATLELISQIDLDAVSVRGMAELLDSDDCREVSKFMLMGLDQNIIVRELVSILKLPDVKTEIKAKIEEILQFHKSQIVKRHTKKLA